MTDQNRQNTSSDLNGISTSATKYNNANSSNNYAINMNERSAVTDVFGGSYPTQSSSSHKYSKLRSSPNLSRSSSLSRPNYQEKPSALLRLSSAVFYACTSCMITIVNKKVLTNYSLPNAHFLAIGQLTSSVFILLISKYLFKVLDFPGFSRQTIRRILPLPLFFMGNLFGGLMGTKNLGLPMFTVLRRFSILLTMIGETILLKIQQPFAVRFCVFIMILGSMVAALNDLAFNWLGYTCITVNNLATAANNCYTKKKLESKELGKFGMLFYNSLFTLPCAAYLVYYGGSDQNKNGFVEIVEFSGWNDSLFLAYFGGSCVMALLLNYSVILCTQHNSPLVTTVVGCLKNIVVTVYGMWFPTSDYIFSWSNSVGVTISVVGSLAFSWFTFVYKK